MRQSIAAVACMLLCSAVTVAAETKIVRPAGADLNASWSHGILVGDTLYISGRGGEDVAGKIPGDFEADVKKALDNIGTVLKAAGMAPTDVVSVQVYLTESGYIRADDVVYKAYFATPSHPDNCGRRQACGRGSPKMPRVCMSMVASAFQ